MLFDPVGLVNTVAINVPGLQPWFCGLKGFGLASGAPYRCASTVLVLDLVFQPSSSAMSSICCAISTNFWFLFIAALRKRL